MKTLRMIGLALVAIVLCVSFAACGSDDDDDNNGGGGLAGTTWKVVGVSSSDADMLEDFNEWKGYTVKLNSNGTITFTPDAGWSYARWTYSAPTLKFTLGEGHADDCVVGALTISGNTAQWNCYWEDADGEWSNAAREHTIVTLQKQ